MSEYSDEDKELIKQTVIENRNKSRPELVNILSTLLPKRSKTGLLRYLERQTGIGELPKQELSNGIDDWRKRVRSYHIFDDYFRIKPPCMVFADTHNPYVALKPFDDLLWASKELGCKTVIHVGDFFNINRFSKHYGTNDFTGSAPTVKEELYIANKVMEELRGTFDNIYFTTGRHDQRFSLAVEFAFQTREIWEFSRGKSGMDGIQVSPYYYCEIGRNWRAEHPGARGTATRGAYGKGVCAKYHRSVIIPHQHYSGWQIDVSGKFIIIDMGAMTNSLQHDYMNLQGGKYPKPDNAFVYIDENEKGWLFVDHARYPSVREIIKNVML